MTRKIKWCVEMINNHSAQTEGEIEVEDDATDEDIEQAVTDAIFGSGLISYGWHEVDK
jgi:hypothetical protein